MAIKVKCQACGASLDRDLAYKVMVGKANRYYCTQQEYIRKLSKDNLARAVKDDTYDKIYYFFGEKVTHTYLYTEISTLASVYSYEKIRSYIQDNQEKLERAMNKNFQSEYAKIKYFCAILRNHLADYIPSEEEIYITDNEYELVEIKYKPKKKRRGMCDLETELLDG